MTSKKIWIAGGVAIGAVVLIGVLVVSWLKSEIESTQFTDDTIDENIVIGNDALNIPRNHFRFADQRNLSVLKQADLAMLWPSAGGYSQANKEEFLVGHNLIFITIKKRELALGMNGRYLPIYKQLLDGSSTSGPSDIKLFNFKKNVGYDGEQLALWQEGDRIWVARCYKGENSVQSTCMHDMNMGKDLVVIYRFNAQLLSKWREIQNLVSQKLSAMIAP